MAARFDEKLEPLGGRSTSAHREDAGGRITNLNASVLLADGLEILSAVKKPGVTLFTDVPALLAGHETEAT